MDDENDSVSSSSDSVDEAAEKPYSTSPHPDIAIWLVKAVAALRQRYPHDNFDTVMIYEAFDLRTGNAIISQPGEPFPSAGPDVGYRRLPMMRCRDCRSRGFTLGPARTIEDFAIHRTDQYHREQVFARRNRMGSGKKSDDTESSGNEPDSLQDSHLPLTMVARKTAEELMENVHYTISRNATGCTTTEAASTVVIRAHRLMQCARDEQDRNVPSDGAFRYFAIRNRGPLSS